MNLIELENEILNEKEEKFMFKNAISFDIEKRQYL